MEGRVSTLEARLDGLARELRWTRRGAAAAIGIAVLAISGGAQSAARRPAEMRATRFVLVDAAGAPVGAFEAAANGQPRLELTAAAGKPAVVLEGGVAPRIWVAGVENKGGVALTTESGVPRLALKDSDGRDRLWVALRLNSPAIQFLNPGGLARSGITTFNEDGGVAVISEAGGSSPGLVLYGKDRNVVWSAP